MDTETSPSLEARLRQVEDQLAIYQVVAGYLYAVDGLNAEAVGACYVEDAVYAVGDLGAYQGREEIAGITRDPAHIQRVETGCAHLATLPHVVIQGDRASATCHMVVALRGEDGFSIWRLSASRLELARQPAGGWKILRRQNYLLDGDPAGPALLKRLLEGPTLQ